MTKNQTRMFIQSTVELYLDQINSITKSYQRTFEILEKNAEEILFMRNDQLKYLVSTIKLCLSNIDIKEMRVKFVHGAFKVKIKTY